MNLAPIVLFTYRRLNHTKKTIEALVNNTLAKYSDIYIYSDGARSLSDNKEVLEVRKYLKTIVGFKNITIIEQDINKGLANSIISGVTNIVNKYGKVIVLEDDIVTSVYFLLYMNNALHYYENNNQVWHISGWNYPIQSDGLEDTFMWRMMNCWGWATWKNRWDNFERKPKDLVSSYSEYDIYKFDLDGTGGFWNQVVKNNNKEMHTWAIFWYSTIFNNNGLCLNPTKSYVKNIGFDGSGTNTGVRKNYESELSNSINLNFTDNIYENDLALYRIKFFLITDNKNLQFSKNINKVINKLRNLDKSKKYILYGAGSGAKFILSFFADNIEYVVDNNNRLHGSYFYDKKIYPLSNISSEFCIIISVFGRELEIKNFLLQECHLHKDKIISFDLL